MPYPAPVKIADLQGQPLIDGEGVELGNLAELVVDVHSGKIAFAVVSSGGFLGIGDRLFAVPWQVLEVDRECRLVLNVPRKLLDESAGFDREHWPAMDDPHWAREVHRQFGVRHGTEHAPLQ